MKAKNLAIKAYNFGIRKRNKLVRGDYKLQTKGRKAVNFATNVSHNVVADLNSGDVNDMFPFQMPRQQEPQRKRRKERNPFFY